MLSAKREDGTRITQLNISLPFSNLFYQCEDALFWSEAEFLAWNLSCQLAEELQNKFHPVRVPQGGKGTGEEMRYWIQGFHIFDRIFFSMA